MIIKLRENQDLESLIKEMPKATIAQEEIYSASPETALRLINMGVADPWDGYITVRVTHVIEHLTPETVSAKIDELRDLVEGYVNNLAEFVEARKFGVQREEYDKAIDEIVQVKQMIADLLQLKHRNILSEKKTKKNSSKRKKKGR